MPGEKSALQRVHIFAYSFFRFLLQCTTDMFVTEEAAKEVEVSHSFTQLFEQIF